jgi:hypothetical protein
MPRSRRVRQSRQTGAEMTGTTINLEAVLNTAGTAVISGIAGAVASRVIQDESQAWNQE